MDDSKITKEILAAMANQDLMAIYKTGPEEFFKELEAEIFTRMAREPTLKERASEASEEAAQQPKRFVSAAARKRISAAQKKRWRNWRKRQ